MVLYTPELVMVPSRIGRSLGTDRLRCNQDRGHQENTTRKPSGNRYQPFFGLPAKFIKFGKTRPGRDVGARVTWVQDNYVQNAGRVVGLFMFEDVNGQLLT